jgi:hypothetical protein
MASRANSAIGYFVVHRISFLYLFTGYTLAYQFRKTLRSFIPCM